MHILPSKANYKGLQYISIKLFGHLIFSETIAIRDQEHFKMQNIKLFNV